MSHQSKYEHEQVNLCAEYLQTRWIGLEIVVVFLGLRIGGSHVDAVAYPKKTGGDKKEKKKG